MDKDLMLGQSLETAEEDAHTLQGEVSAGHHLNSLFSRQEGSGATETTITWDVHRVSPPHKRKPDHGNCYRCGKAGHKATKCRFRDAHAGQVNMSECSKYIAEEQVSTTACVRGKRRGES